MTPLLDVRRLVRTWRGPNGGTIRAVDDVSLSIAAGETLGLVGESGSGKSTLGRTILRLIEPESGEVFHAGRDLARLSASQLRAARREMQIVFQDPFGSLNPRHKVGTIVTEPLVIHGVGDAAQRKARLAELLDLVGLPHSAAQRFPHEFSGGQRQRIAIARALALSPKFLVADEPVSALDVSVQSQIVNLLIALRAKLGLSVLFISHDLSVIRHVSDRVAVMYLGRIVETGATEDLYANPRHPYTQALLSAIPRPGVRRPERIHLQGETPSPENAPSGCAFRTRCPRAEARCAAERPTLRSVGAGAVACHFADAP